MVLLSGMMRTAAITGSTDSVFADIAGRQGGQWAKRTVGMAFPAARCDAPSSSPAAHSRPLRDTADTLRELTRLRERGIITDGEFKRLRADLPA